MERKILFLDLDGTLLTDEKEISPGNRQAVAAALARGHHVVVTSGRPLKSALAQAERLGLAGEGCYTAAYNGALLYDCSARTEIFRRALEPEVLRALFGEARRRGVYVHTYDREDVVIEPWCGAENAERYCQRIGLAWRRVEDVGRDLSGPASKALLIDYQDPGPLREMEAWIGANLAGRADCVSSCPWFVEAGPAGVNKGTAVRELCARLGIAVENSIAAGDERNDVSMLRAAGLGAAVANAVPAVKAAAGYVAQRDNNHDGVAEIIERFML